MVKSPVIDLRTSFLFSGRLPIHFCLSTAFVSSCIFCYAMLLFYLIYLMKCLIYSHFLCDFFLWIICYWRVCCLISTYMQIFNFHFVIDFWFHSTVFGKDIFGNIWKILFTFAKYYLHFPCDLIFMICLWEIFCLHWGEGVFWCFGEECSKFVC